MNIRQIINTARAAFARARRKFFTRLSNIINADRVASHNRKGKPAKVTTQEQHLIACRQAYWHKAGLVHAGRGKNTLSGIPAGSFA